MEVEMLSLEGLNGLRVVFTVVTNYISVVTNYISR
jgi:hypothetical protein